MVTTVYRHYLTNHRSVGKVPNLSEDGSMLSFFLALLNTYSRVAEMVGRGVCNCAPTILIYEIFHQLSKETKILKIGQYLAELVNYNYFNFFKSLKHL